MCQNYRTMAWKTPFWDRTPCSSLNSLHHGNDLQIGLDINNEKKISWSISIINRLFANVASWKKFTKRCGRFRRCTMELYKALLNFHFEFLCCYCNFKKTYITREISELKFRFSKKVTQFKESSKFMLILQYVNIKSTARIHHNMCVIHTSCTRSK